MNYLLHLQSIAVQQGIEQGQICNETRKWFKGSKNPNSRETESGKQLLPISIPTNKTQEPQKEGGPGINLTTPWSALTRLFSHNGTPLKSGSQPSRHREEEQLFTYIQKFLYHVESPWLYLNSEEKEKLFLLIHSATEIRDKGREKIREVSLPHARCRFTEKFMSADSPVGDAFISFKFIRLKNLGTFIAGEENQQIFILLLF